MAIEPQDVYDKIVELLKPRAEVFIAAIEALEAGNTKPHANVVLFKGNLRNIDDLWDYGNVVSFLKEFGDALPEISPSKKMVGYVRREILDLMNSYYRQNHSLHDEKQVREHVMGLSILEGSIDGRIMAQITKYVLPPNEIGKSA